MSELPNDPLAHAEVWQDTAAITSICVTFPFYLLFFSNRHVYPLAQREPLMALLSSMVATYLVALWLFAVGHHNVLYWQTILVGEPVLGLTLGVYFVRAWKLYMIHGITNERVKNAPGWFVARRYYASRKFLFILLISMFVVHVGLMILDLVAAAPILNNPTTYASASTTTYILVIGCLAYFIAFIVLAIKMAGLKDGFFIKQELRAVGIGDLLIFVGYLIRTLFALPCPGTASCGLLITFLFPLWDFAWTIVFPLYHATKDPRFRWFAWLRRSNWARLRSRTEDNSKISSTHGSEAPSKSELLSEEQLENLKGVTLAKFLTNAAGREAFRAFTVREFSVENLLFVEAVDQYRLNANVSRADAQALFAKFVAFSSPYQVNLPGLIFKSISSRVEDTTGAVDYKTLFDEAYTHVMKLMQRDVFRRFKHTAEWEEHVADFNAEMEAMQKDKSSKKTVTENSETRPSSSTNSQPVAVVVVAEPPSPAVSSPPSPVLAPVANTEGWPQARSANNASPAISESPAPASAVVDVPSPTESAPAESSASSTVVVDMPATEAA